jgi:hypothetical protein
MTTRRTTLGSKARDDGAGLARTAHDADNVLHLVALVDDVDGWVVKVGGKPVHTDDSGFRNDPTGRWAGRPSWCIEGGPWELVVDGEPVTVDSPSPTQVLPSAPAGAHSWATEPIEQLARTWSAHPERPRLDEAGKRRWDELIDWWVGDSEHPLPVRSKSTGRRGSVAELARRTVVFTDNSPAQWIFARAVLQGWTPSVSELDAALAAKDMPVAQILRRDERETATWTATLARVPSTGALGWRLHHIDPVSTGKKIEAWTADDIEGHARRFLSPSNMFVLPSELKGLGEVPGFIEAMAQAG